MRNILQSKSKRIVAGLLAAAVCTTTVLTGQPTVLTSYALTHTVSNGGNIWRGGAQDTYGHYITTYI